MKAGTGFEYSAAAFLWGIALASIVTVSPTVPLCLGSIGAAALLWGVFARFRNRIFIIVAALVLVGFSVGLLRYLDGSNFDRTLAGRGGERVKIGGVISEEPDMREGGQYLNVSVVEEGSGRRVGNVLVMTERYPAFQYGDRVSLEGKLSVPGKF